MRRLLQPDEWHRIFEPLQTCFGEDKLPPDPGTSLCAIEEDDEGNIKGFLFLQLALHIEPFGSLDHASFRGLKEVIDTALTNSPDIVYYLHTDNPIGLEKLCAAGFTPKGVILEGRPK